MVSLLLCLDIDSFENSFVFSFQKILQVVCSLLNIHFDNISQWPVPTCSLEEGSLIQARLVFRAKESSLQRLAGTLNMTNLSFIFTFPFHYLFLFHSQSVEFKTASLFPIFDFYKSKHFHHQYCSVRKWQTTHLRDSRLHIWGKIESCEKLRQMLGEKYEKAMCVCWEWAGHSPK